MRSQLNPGHILKPHHRAVRIGRDDDVLKLANRVETPLGLERELKITFTSVGGSRNPARRRLEALRLDGVRHVSRCQIEGSQLVWIDPYAHAVGERAELRDVADAGKARKCVLHFDRSIIA